MLARVSARSRHAAAQSQVIASPPVASTLRCVAGVLATLAVVALGRVSSRSVAIRGDAVSGPRARQLAEGVQITGYRTSDGAGRSFHGAARLQNGTLELVSPGTWGDSEPGHVSLPIDEVTSLDTSVGALPVLAGIYVYGHASGVPEDR